MTERPTETRARTLAELPELLDVADLAAYFGCTPDWVYRRLRDGSLDLEPIPTGGRMLFSRFQLERLVKAEPRP